MLKTLFAAVLTVCLVTIAWAEEADHAIHEELRAVTKQLTTAINSGRFDDMLPVLSEQIRATPINQEYLASRAEVSAYFKKWFGSGGYLKKLDIELLPDALTELSADKTWGVVWGKGVEKYVLSDGRPFEMHTRWTATVVKENDGHWRLRTIHIGTNFLDNPILTAAEHAIGKAAAVGGAIGLLLGVLGTWLVMRKKKGVGN
jgi:ketosteroid isomerase-like protein